MFRPDLYIDAVDTQEFTELYSENKLPLVVVSSKKELANLSKEERKVLDTYYSNDGKDRFFSNVFFSERTGTKKDWGKIIYPNGQEANVLGFTTKEYATNKYDEQNRQIHKLVSVIQTDRGDYDTGAIAIELKGKIKGLTLAADSRTL